MFLCERKCLHKCVWHEYYPTCSNIWRQDFLVVETCSSQRNLARLPRAKWMQDESWSGVNWTPWHGWDLKAWCGGDRSFNPSWAVALPQKYQLVVPQKVCSTGDAGVLTFTKGTLMKTEHVSSIYADETAWVLSWWHQLCDRRTFWRA